MYNRVFTPEQVDFPTTLITYVQQKFLEFLPFADCLQKVEILSYALYIFRFMRFRSSGDSDSETYVTESFLPTRFHPHQHRDPNVHGHGYMSFGWGNLNRAYAPRTNHNPDTNQLRTGPWSWIRNTMKTKRRNPWSWSRYV